MTKQQLQEYIQRRLLARAASKYPHDEHLQLVYQLGFLQAQLANAMYDDSKYVDKFKQSIEQ